jgi:serine protease Do
MRTRALVLILLMALAPTGCRTGNVLDRTPSSRVFQATIAQVLPSVAFIEIRASEGALSGASGSEEPVPPGPPGGAPPGTAPRRPPGAPVFEAGSGVIVTADGYILTSSHVVQGASQVRVTLYDRRQFDAQVIALDPSTDIAVVKIEGEGFPVAEMGRSDAVKIGEWVLALGSPLGLLFTATSGIISGKGRSLGILEQPGGQLRAPPLENFLQTDAAINPGNSGGPLVDLRGRVIGINTAIATETGLFSGVGFAVPIDLARRVAQDLINYGYVRRPFLGVMAQDVTAVDVEVFDLPAARGAKVVQIVDGSPAAQAGLDLGDVIIGLDNREVNTASDLQADLAELEPGSTVQIHIIRAGKEIVIPVELGLIQTGGPPPPGTAEPQSAPRLGFGVAEEAGRVVVAAVGPYTPAARAGVRPGQVIVSVNRHEVRTVDEFVAAIQSVPGDVVLLIVDDPEVGRLLIDYELGSMPQPGS